MNTLISVSIYPMNVGEIFRLMLRRLHKHTELENRKAKQHTG